MCRYGASTKIIIQLNSNQFFIYLRADLTAQRPTTKQARIKEREETDKINTNIQTQI
jgi:hypothetical protein